MVRCNIYFPEDLLAFKNSICINESIYYLESDCTSWHTQLEEDTNTPFVVEIRSSPQQGDNTHVSIWKKILSAITMMLITSWSTDIYDCDYSQHYVKLLLWPDSSSRIDIHLRRAKQSTGSRLLLDHCGGAIEVQTMTSTIDHDYAKGLFAEFNVLNNWRTGISTLILLFLSCAGLASGTMTTVVFSLIILSLIWLMFFYTKKKLNYLLHKISDTTG